tara:strand:- start:543 stop:845 length:303 start_codon:yes stop_codon:yes gene_type:complete
MKTAALWIFGLLLLGGVIYSGPEIREHFGTRYASADREIFENSKPFIHGQIENLSRLRLEYQTTENADHKSAIRLMVVTQTATLDKSQVPYDLQQWINSL